MNSTENDIWGHRKSANELTEEELWMHKDVELKNIKKVKRVFEQKKESHLEQEFNINQLKLEL